jgi:hypothetical protein
MAEPGNTAHTPVADSRHAGGTGGSPAHNTSHKSGFNPTTGALGVASSLDHTIKSAGNCSRQRLAASGSLARPWGHQIAIRSFMTIQLGTPSAQKKPHTEAAHAADQTGR